jgi:DNA-binding transcriptional LysR family regulator
MKCGAIHGCRNTASEGVRKIETNLITDFDHARRLTESVNGHLYITILGAIDPSTFPTPVIEWVHCQYPSIEIEGSVCGFDALMKRLRSKQTDFVLGKKFHLQSESGLNGFLIYPVTQSVIMPANHPLAKQPSVNIQELSSENFIVLELSECPNHINSLVSMYTKEGGYPKIVK